MGERVFDRSGYIPISFEYDEGEGRYIVGSHQDVAPIMEDIHARQTDGTAGWNADRTMKHRARIPMAVYDGWLREAQNQGIPIYHKEVWKKWLDRKLADYEKLQIKGRAPGRIGFS